MLKNIAYCSLLVFAFYIFSCVPGDRLWYDDQFSGLIYETHELDSASEPDPKPVVPSEPKPPVKPAHYNTSSFHHEPILHVPINQPSCADADIAYQVLAKEAGVILGIPNHQQLVLKQNCKDSSEPIVILEEGIFINQDYYAPLSYGVKRLHIFCALNKYYYTFGNRSFLQSIGLIAHYIPEAEIIYYQAIKKAACYQCVQEVLDFKQSQGGARPEELFLQSTVVLYNILTENNALCMHHAHSV